MEIEKKIWPEYFEMMIDGKKNIELRLADFKLNKGDVLALKEWDPKTKEYTGKIIKKKVKNLIKFNPLDKHTEDEIKQFGFYEIELENSGGSNGN